MICTLWCVWMMSLRISASSSINCSFVVSTYIKPASETGINCLSCCVSNVSFHWLFFFPLWVCRSLLLSIFNHFFIGIFLFHFNLWIWIKVGQIVWYSPVNISAFRNVCWLSCRNIDFPTVYLTPASPVCTSFYCVKQITMLHWNSTRC